MRLPQRTVRNDGTRQIQRQSSRSMPECQFLHTFLSPGFRAVNSDKKGARDMAIGVASLLAPVPHGWHLGHALFDVGMAAYDLIKGWREAVHPE